MALVTTRAAKTETIMPIKRVTAKPLTGPVARAYSTRPIRNVVTFASVITDNAFEKPSSSAKSPLFPDLYSSFILSKIITFASTAIPIERIKPAIPGSVKVILRLLNKLKRILENITKEKTAATPLLL